MKAEYDFSKGERGKFYDPKAVFNLPIYLEKDVDEFMRKLADETGKDVGEIVNEWLRGKMQLTLKEHINDIRTGLETGQYKNEAAVSQGIVLRLLKVLGWPTFNTQIVHPEYAVGRGKVDFALCRPKSTPRIFIEVKRVENIEWAEQQLFEYALDHGVIPIAVLTDGEKWRFFHLMGLEYYRELTVRELDFIKSSTEEIADCLNRYLSYQSIRTGEAIRTMKKDYERVYKQKIESKPVPSIPSELRHVIVPPNAEDNEVFFNKTAWKVAHMRWWSVGWKETGQEKDSEEIIQVRESSLESIQRSDVYEHCVKYLIKKTYPTTEKLDWWCRTGFYEKDMPKKFGHLVRLSPERAQQIIDEVREEYNSTTHEDNKDA